MELGGRRGWDSGQVEEMMDLLLMTLALILVVPFKKQASQKRKKIGVKLHLLLPSQFPEGRNHRFYFTHQKFKCCARLVP